MSNIKQPTKLSEYKEGDYLIVSEKYCPYPWKWRVIHVGEDNIIVKKVDDVSIGACITDIKEIKEKL